MHLTSHITTVITDRSTVLPNTAIVKARVILTVVDTYIATQIDIVIIYERHRHKSNQDIAIEKAIHLLKDIATDTAIAIAIYIAIYKAMDILTDIYRHRHSHR